MKKYMLIIFTIFLFSPFQIGAQTQNQSQREEVDFPWVPRISAHEAYVKYKAGKAIILHAGGEKFSGRRILGAINLNHEELGKDVQLKILRKFPKEGIEIFTYCY
jgi:hypothetical protein